MDEECAPHPKRPRSRAGCAGEDETESQREITCNKRIMPLAGTTPTQTLRERTTALSWHVSHSSEPWKISRQRMWRWQTVLWYMAPGYPIEGALMMEAARTSDSWAYLHETTWRYITDGCHFQKCRLITKLLHFYVFPQLPTPHLSSVICQHFTAYSRPGVGNFFMLEDRINLAAIK
jgi:hypothetical protein